MPLVQAINSRKKRSSQSRDVYHETRILVQPNDLAADSLSKPTHHDGDSVRDRFSWTGCESEMGAAVPSSPSPPTALVCRLAVTVVLALSMLAGGMLLFINGFFLSRDDLPYISTGRELPFPPLFPHLHPVSLELNRQEGIYYARLPKVTVPGDGNDERKQDGPALKQVDLKDYLTSQLSSLTTGADACETVDCDVSWVSVTPFDRAVILLIDAMRFDFLLWDPEVASACQNDTSLECEPASPAVRPFYRNRLPFVHDLLRRADPDLNTFITSLVRRQTTRKVGIYGGKRTQAEPNTAGSSSLSERHTPADPSKTQGSSQGKGWGGNHFTRLYIFEADPPTATTQRLTGLATGSMPSFFSVRETFSASPVTVDSLLMQLKAARKTSVAIGDDTWERCFGHLLSRAHVFPSLNIQDLHTVDDGVKAELPREFAKGDWAFLVGHTLGVDHVGHADVLDSEFMGKKLVEVNTMLKDTIKTILSGTDGNNSRTPSKTLFLFFGDHGMTEAGAHGGGSSEEVEAGLFSFSMLPASLSPRAAQELSPASRLVHSRLPSYLQSHGALSEDSGRRRVKLDAASRSSSPTPTLGYGSRRVRQVGLAPTLSLLLGLPIPFNSMGQVIADLVPTLGSFVEECSPSLMEASVQTSFEPSEGKQDSGERGANKTIASAVRCSDLAYLTQLHHISAWQQHRAIVTHAAVTGNKSVLTDSQFAAAKDHWLTQFSELDKEIKALPGQAHLRLFRKKASASEEPSDGEALLELPPQSLHSEEEELLSYVSHVPQGASATVEGTTEGNQTTKANNGGKAASVSSLLPSLVPYLLAASEFSQEALLASIRQLGTFNLQLMLCGIVMTLCSFLILVCASVILKSGSQPHLEATGGGQYEHELPAVVTIIRWLGMSVCIGSLVWIAAWASLKACKSWELCPFPAVDVVLWRQLPVLLVTGASFLLVFPFANGSLRWFSRTCAPRTLHCRMRHEEVEPLVEEQQADKAFIVALRQKICLSRVGLNLFGGGTYMCYFSLAALCAVPFNDCLVNRECSVVRFLVCVYCMLTGLAVLSTPSRGAEKSRILSACAALMVCVRVGSAFDLAENANEEEGSTSSALQVNTVSSAVLLLPCIFLLAGREQLPCFARATGPQPCTTGDAACGEYSRFRTLEIRPLEGQRWRPCTMERVVFLLQGALVLFWFALPHDSKSQQSSAQSSQTLHQNSSQEVVVAWLWAAASWAFETIDSLAAAWLAPLKLWTFAAPPWLVDVLPKQLLDGGQVKVFQMFHIFLPWLVYIISGCSWLQMALILCRMKKRENDLSILQLKRAKACFSSSGEELSSCSDVGRPMRFIHQRGTGSLAFWLWRVEFWDYFAQYLLFTAVCPLCMYVMILGRAQLWPLLICCAKWRLLYFLSRVAVEPPLCDLALQAGSVANACGFCRAKATLPAGGASLSRPGESKGAESGSLEAEEKEAFHFLLSDASVYTLGGLLALDTFFATGHRMKLSALPVEAGYIGLVGFHPVWSIVTSFLHTYLIYMVCCPFMFMVVFSRLAHVARICTENGRKEEPKKSTADALVQTALLKTGRAALSILNGVTLRHLFSLLSLTVLRNHLFIWDLFAVKFLYDGIAACLAYVLVTLTLLFVCAGICRTPVKLQMTA
ncbi:hypothetical protein Efla_003158 [Eimeria flavescens]